MGKYRGKYSKKKRIPLTSWLMLIVAVLCLVVGGVMAYLSNTTGAVTNAMTPEEASAPAVLETFENETKSNVALDVGNPGYAVYVRAAVVVTWKDQNGNVLGKAPVEGEDYTMVLGADWFRGDDGFYYYRYPVAFDEASDNPTTLTTNLIESCFPLADKTPEGYGLNVEIIAQTIQAVGTTDEEDVPAVSDAWGIPVSTTGPLYPATQPTEESTPTP